MADEQTSEVTDDAEAGEEIETPSRGRGRFVLFGVLALFGIAAGAGGFFWWQSNAKEAPVVGASTEPSFEIEAGREFADEFGLLMPEPQVGAGEEGGSGSESHMGKITTLEPFVVNIADGDRDRYLKLKADIELSDPNVGAELTERMPQVRDLIISLLGGKSFEEIRSIEGKNFLREEILLRVNSLLVSGQARRVFFTEFVVQ